MIIKVKNLKKYYRVSKNKPGLMGSLANLFHRQYKLVKAVDGISFNIKKGELVGFIGPNGAGKTTTLKCLSGLLYPDKGKISVLSSKPFDRQSTYLKQIALVMGQKHQLWWDLPGRDTFLFNKAVYEIETSKFNRTLNQLIEMLGVGDLIDIPVRRLSLGERMKMELIAALIHSPQVLFLDEPTIGLDVVMQKKVRDFIADYNHQFKATVLLTSHYMEDVRRLCQRVIIIDKGKLVYDGLLAALVKKYARFKLIRLQFADNNYDRRKLALMGKLIHYQHPLAVFKVERAQTSLAVRLLQEFPVADLTIEEEPIEDIVRRLFTREFGK